MMIEELDECKGCLFLKENECTKEGIFDLKLCWEADPQTLKTSMKKEVK